MKEILLTCPFTGQPFTALIDTDDNLYCKHALTGELMKINFNWPIKRYMIPKSYLERIDTVSFTDAAELLGVSRQRISAIAANDTIRSYELNGQKVFLMSDVLKYKETRKVGAPRKD